MKLFPLCQDFIPFHPPVYVSTQYHTIWIALALWYILRSGNLICSSFSKLFRLSKVLCLF